MTAADPRNRREEYAKVTLLLRREPHTPGAQSLFNQALTAALVEIAVHEGHPVEAKNRIPSATDLLEDLCSTIGKATKNSLTRAVRETDPVRHGRSTQRDLAENEVEALAELDMHPALRALDNTAADDDWVRAKGADESEMRRAKEYLNLIEAEVGYDEVQRRADDAPKFTGSPGDPDAHAEWCPVCDQETLLTTGCDIYGYGLGVGTCSVCSYYRSGTAADSEALDMAAERFK